VRKVYKAGALFVVLIGLAGCAPSPAFAASPAEPAAPIPGGLSWWQLTWIVGAILVFAVATLAIAALCDASDRAAGLTDDTGDFDIEEPASNVRLFPAHPTPYSEPQQRVLSAIADQQRVLDAVVEKQRTYNLRSAATINADQVHVARSVPYAPGTMPLALTITDDQGNTILVTFRDPHAAIAAGVALKIEGTIAASHTIREHQEHTW
jgi:hypothetical protein